MAIKCSARRIKLQYAQQLLAQLVALNEQTLITATALAGLSVADIGDTANRILGAAGVATYSADTDDTITSELVTMLKAIDWAWATE